MEAGGINIGKWETSVWKGTECAPKAFLFWGLLQQRPISICLLSLCPGVQRIPQQLEIHLWTSLLSMAKGDGRLAVGAMLFVTPHEI